MKILVPIHSFEPGGVERVALRLARAWSDDGHEVKILLGRVEGAAQSSAPALDYVGFPEPFATRRRETLWLIACLVRQLRRERPDVLFCPGNTYTIVCAAAKLLTPRRCPPVLAKISNDLDPRLQPRLLRAPYRLWLRIQGKLLERFVAISPAMARPSAWRLGIADDAIVVIPDPALDRTELARLARIERRKRGSPHVVAIGRLAPQKNFALLLEAFARLNDGKATLTIAGEGPERARLERSVERHGLEDRVTLLGHIDDVPTLLSSADLVALSSNYEGVPAVVIEALAAGLPIAATRCCASMGALLGEGRFGALARVGSARSLARAIEWAAQMDFAPADARAHVMPFTLERGAKAYVEAFRTLLTDAREIGARVAPGH